MSDSFYSDGLRFECTRCSRCCRHEPGYVFITEGDLQSLARATGLAEQRFLTEYCREVRVGGFRRISLREKANYDCILWSEGGCEVYEHRPFQCRSYPFWTSNLNSAEAWEELKGECPGVGRGKLHSSLEISTWLRQHFSQRYLDGPTED